MAPEKQVVVAMKIDTGSRTLDRVLPCPIPQVVIVSSRCPRGIVERQFYNAATTIWVCDPAISYSRVKTPDTPLPPVAASAIGVHIADTVLEDIIGARVDNLEPGEINAGRGDIGA